MGAIDDAIGTTAGIIPLALVGGMAMKMTDSMLNAGGETAKRKRRSAKPKKDDYLKKAHKVLGIG